MTVPILVQQTNGVFSASLAGSPEVRCIRPSRAEAIAAIQSEISQKMASGELVDIEVPLAGVSGMAGIFKDDPEWPGIIEQIYRDRDAERPQ